MTWCRMDDDFYTHPKVVALSDRAFRVYVMHEGVDGIAAMQHERLHIRTQLRAIPDRRSALSPAPPAFDIKRANRLLQARIDELDKQLKLSAARLAPVEAEPEYAAPVQPAPAERKELGGVQL